MFEPKPLQKPRPTIYAGGEPPAGKALIAERCDGWLTHGDLPEVIAPKVADMVERRERAGLPPMVYGAAGYAVVRPTEREAAREVCTPEQVAEQILAFERAGLDLMLLQFSPQYEEMERFAEEVISLVRRGRRSGRR